MSSRKDFGSKKKPSKQEPAASSIEEIKESTHSAIERREVFIHDPKDKQRAKKFEREFGVTYSEGTKTLHPLAIAPIYKLAIHGIPHPYGVISTTPIQANETLAEYTGVITNDEPEDMSYIYRVGKAFIDGRTIGSIGRFFNHSDNNNCEFVIENGKVLVKTLRPIQPGEQLTVNYGHKYFTTDINRVYIDAYHTALSYEEMFLQNQENYTQLSKLKNANMKKTIRQLMNAANETSIFIPTLNYPNYPIVALSNTNQMGRNPKEMTLFHVLCWQQNDPEQIRAAVENGADLNIQDSHGHNALFYVISNPDVSDKDKAATLNYLFGMRYHEKAAFMTDSNFKTIFHYCIENNSNRSMAVLLNAVVFDNAHFDHVVESPIFTAIRVKNTEALALIMQKYTSGNLKQYFRSGSHKEYLIKAIAAIPEEDIRNTIYSIFSDFVNVGILAAQVQEHINLQAERSQPRRTRLSYQSNVPSSDSETSMEETKEERRAPSARGRIPNLRYASSTFVSSPNTAKKRKPEKENTSEIAGPEQERSADNSHDDLHTMFSRKKHKTTITESPQNTSRRHSTRKKVP
jgi:hypothetical protein